MITGRGTLSGGTGDDGLSSYGADSRVYGDTGNDRLSGSGMLYGGAGDDHILSYLFANGEAGNDTLLGSGKLYGGDGDDRLGGYRYESAEMHGGAGRDVFVIAIGTHFQENDGEYDTLTDFKPTTDRLELTLDDEARWDYFIPNPVYQFGGTGVVPRNTVRVTYDGETGLLSAHATLVHLASGHTWSEHLVIANLPKHLPLTADDVTFLA